MANQCFTFENAVEASTTKYQLQMTYSSFNVYKIFHRF